MKSLRLAFLFCLFPCYYSVAQPSGGGNLCPGVSEAGMCLASSTMKMYSLSNTDLSKITKETLCRELSKYRACVGTKLDKCESLLTTSFDMFGDLLDYVCLRRGFKQLTNALSCFSDKSVFMQHQLCVTENTGGGICGMTDVYTQCASHVLSGKCPSASLTDLNVLLDVYFAPYNDRFCKSNSTKAPTTTTTLAPTTTSSTTTTTPSTTTTSTTVEPSTTKPAKPTKHVVHKCYACKSGAYGFWQNKQCPASGKLYGSGRRAVKCKGRCVSIITEGGVIRGCSSQHWYGDAEIPDNGCINVNKDVHCFCQGNKCNSQDMRPKLEDYMNAH